MIEKIDICVILAFIIAAIIIFSLSMSSYNNKKKNDRKHKMKEFNKLIRKHNNYENFTAIPDVIVNEKAIAADNSDNSTGVTGDARKIIVPNVDEVDEVNEDEASGDEVNEDEIIEDSIEADVSDAVDLVDVAVNPSIDIDDTVDDPNIKLPAVITNGRTKPITSEDTVLHLETDRVSKQEVNNELKKITVFEADIAEPVNVRYTQINSGPQIKCKNKSINDRFSSGKIPLPKNQVQNCNKQYEDISLYYRQDYSFPRSFLIDPVTNGANYADYSNYAKTYDIGDNLIKKTRKLPFGYNYAFPT